MIMHVITNFTANAGAERMLSRLLDATAEPAIVVSLIDVADHYRDASSEQVRFISLGCRSAAQLTFGILKLSRVMAREKPTAVLCWMYHAMVAGSLAGRLSGIRAPLYWNVRQSLDDRRSFSRNTLLAARAARHLSHLPAGIIFNSARSLELHRQYGYRNGNVIVIPNGIEPADADDAVQEKEPRVVGIAARLHPQKDHRTFFRAAALAVRSRPGVRFVAAGAGMTMDNPDVRNMVAESGLPSDTIQLLGELDDMDAFYRSIDILALSSRTEGFPNVVAEAMNHGKPVVSSDVGDAAAIIGETGVVVPPGDPEALARGIGSMLNLSPSAYAALSAAAADRVRSLFSLQNSAMRYRAFLNSV